MLPRWLSGKECLTVEETWIRSLGPENALEKSMQFTPVSLPGSSHGERSLASCSTLGRKQTDMTLHMINEYLPFIKVNISFRVVTFKYSEILLCLLFP